MAAGENCWSEGESFIDASNRKQGAGTSPGCFEGPNLRHTWFMDESHVQWIGDDRRFEDGRFLNGAREGCWSFWYLDGLFDSGRSGTYERDRKIESAPSPLGDFGRGEEIEGRAPRR